MKVHYPKLYNMAHLLALNVLLLKGVWITSLAHAKGLFKVFLGIIILIVNRFSFFAALFRTFGLQKNVMVIFFLWCFRKVRF